jgi:hypothetical protein
LISAVTVLGIESQPLTTGLFSAQVSRILFFKSFTHHDPVTIQSQLADRH